MSSDGKDGKHINKEKFSLIIFQIKCNGDFDQVNEINKRCTHRGGGGGGG